MRTAAQIRLRTLQFLSRRRSQPLFGVLLAMLAVVVIAPGCAGDTAAEDAEIGPDVMTPDVSAAELASDLRLTRIPPDARGRVSLESTQGNRILLFGGTSVMSVYGHTITAVEPLELRAGDVWMSTVDARAVRSRWAAAHSSAFPAPSFDPLPQLPTLRPRRPPVVRPERKRPVAHSFGTRPSAGERAAWTVPLKRNWRHILIHHSAGPTGNAAAFHRAHLERGWDGLGYNFVIGNGRGSPDGHVEVGYRWRQQKVGAHAGVDELNDTAVGICLVGNFNLTRPTKAQLAALTRLCVFLGEYCGIRPENLKFHGDVKRTECPGSNFPRDFTFTVPRTAGRGRGSITR